MVKKKRLGKGLSALLSEELVQENLEKSEENNLVEINQINLSKFQARKKFDEEKLKELSKSIEKNGLIQPVIVRKINQDFELVAGERRIKACRMAGLNKIPVIISDFDDRKAFEAGLIESLENQHSNLLDEITKEGKISEDLEKSLLSAIEDFKKGFSN